VGNGPLAFTLTWSRNGNADLLVKTPGGKVVSVANPGPDETDGALLDRADALARGPESISWAGAPAPGTYTFCVNTISFAPAVSVGAPVAVTVKVRKAGAVVASVDRTFSAAATGADCTEGDPNFVGTAAYP
jgi:uncharacterized protein YfaP (DUF2135 family)